MSEVQRPRPTAAEPRALAVRDAVVLPIRPAPVSSLGGISDD
ncbi:hypothetical protein [Streptomyces shenzhenensis]|nr:hypothetical protein [Streptomyces shenzhenensis]